MNAFLTSRHLYLCITLCVLLAILPTHAATDNVSDAEDFMEMDLEELMQVEISVVSKKPESLVEAPGIVSVVPREESVVFGDRNLYQLLQRQPSVYTRGSYLYPDNIASFRGDMPTHLDLHNLILFNGRPIRESAFGGVNFPVYMTFPTASLDSVEIIRGPGSVLYGTNAFTGVVNLKTRVPDHNEVSISGMGGSYGYYESQVTAGGKHGKLGYVTSIRSEGQDGYDYRMTDGLGVLGSQNDDNRSFSGMTHLECGGLTFDVFAVDMDTFHLGSLPWWSLLYHEYGVKKLFTNVGYRLPVHDRATLEFNLTYNLQENRFATLDQTANVNTSDFLGEVTLLTNPLDNLNIVLGALKEHRSDYTADDDYYYSIPEYDYFPKSAYAQGDYKIGRFTKVIAGVQWNESAQGYEDIVSRYGVVLTPFREWGIKLLRGEAFRAPYATETDVDASPAIVGNTELRPETITTYDAQLFYSGEKIYAAVTYFNSTIDDLVIRDASVSPASFTNGGRQKFQGVEFEAKHFLTSRWHVLGSAMYQNNQQTSDLNPSTAPDYMVKLGTAYTWDWGSMALTYMHFGKPPRLPTEVVVNPEPEALNLVSANLRMDMAHWFGGPQDRAIFTLKIENLLDQEIWVPEFNRGGNPNSLPDGPGIAAYAGLTYTF